MIIVNSEARVIKVNLSDLNGMFAYYYYTNCNTLLEMQLFVECNDKRGTKVT